MTDKAKTRVAARVTAGGPEPRMAELEVLMAPAVADLESHLRQNPTVAPAFGISAAAIKQLK